MSPARITLRNGRKFFLKSDQDIERHPLFKTLSKKAQESLHWLGIFGTRDGAHIVSLGGRDDASIDLYKSRIDFHGSDESGWGLRVERKPNVIVFEYEGLRIEPVTNREMQAELAAQKRASRREK